MLRIGVRVWVSGLLIMPNGLLLEKKLTSVYWLDSFPVKSNIASVMIFFLFYILFLIAAIACILTFIACSIFIYFYFIFDYSWFTKLRFRYTAKWFSYADTYIHSFSNYFPIFVIVVYWVEFLVLYSRSLLIIYFKYSSLGK